MHRARAILQIFCLVEKILHGEMLPLMCNLTVELSGTSVLRQNLGHKMAGGGGVCRLFAQ